MKGLLTVTSVTMIFTLQKYKKKLLKIEGTNETKTRDKNGFLKVLSL